MIKDDKNTFKYVKLEEGFLNKVFKLGSNNEAEVTYFLEKPKRCLMINHNQQLTTCFLKDAFTINDGNGEEDVQNTTFYRIGMLRILPTETAKEYVADLLDSVNQKKELLPDELLSLISEF